MSKPRHASDIVYHTQQALRHAHILLHHVCGNQLGGQLERTEMLVEAIGEVNAAIQKFIDNEKDNDNHE